MYWNQGPDCFRTDFSYGIFYIYSFLRVVFKKFKFIYTFLFYITESKHKWIILGLPQLILE